MTEADAFETFGPVRPSVSERGSKSIDAATSIKRSWTQAGGARYRRHINGHNRAASGSFIAVMESYEFQKLDRNWSSYRHNTASAIFSEAWERVNWPRPAHAECLIFSERCAHEFEHRRRAMPIQEIPGASVCVAALRAAGWLVAFATGGLREPSLAKLHAADIPFTEDQLVTASEHISREEIVLNAIRAVSNDQNIPPNRIVSEAMAYGIC
jgi:hypothetical protein